MEKTKWILWKEWNKNKNKLEWNICFFRLCNALPISSDSLSDIANLFDNEYCDDMDRSGRYITGDKLTGIPDPVLLGIPLKKRQI